MGEKDCGRNSLYTRKKIECYSYGLQDQIGKGYSSQVFRGRHDETNEAVAVKVIDLKMLKSDINRSLLASEIEILKTLRKQPHILTLHEVYTTKNNTYLITELCHSDLTKRIKLRLSETETFNYMHQLIEGYQSIHATGILHRDLKPANLLISESDILKIADFGFGIKAQQAARPSKYNVGSPLYMAPESLKKNQYSYQTDIWAIGVILYQMLTGDTPWRAKNEKELLRKIQTEPIESVMTRRSHDFCPLITDFLTRALSHDVRLRLTPEQMFLFNFRASGILSEKKLNLTLRATKFDTLKSDISPPRRSSEFPNDRSQPRLTPKSTNKDPLNNDSKDQNHPIIAQKDAILTPHKDIGYVKDLINKDDKEKESARQNKERLRDLNRERARENSTYCGSAKETSQKEAEKDPIAKELTKEDKKSISKILIAEIHFCRFLYKLMVRIKESAGSGLLQNSNNCVQNIMRSYCRIIKHKILNVRQMDCNNFLRTPFYDSYILTSDFRKLQKIAKEYIDRYSDELGPLWQETKSGHSYNDIPHQFPLSQEGSLFEAESTNELIRYLLDRLQERLINPELIDPYQKDIVILDYLMTARQLLDLLKDSEDYTRFARKSRIEEIVEGTTTKITHALYTKITERAKSLLAD